MELKEYLKIHNQKIGEFAELLGVHRNHLSGLINKRFIPGIALARQIEEITNQSVTVNELIPKVEKTVCPCCKRKLAKGKTIQWPSINP